MLLEGIQSPTGSPFWPMTPNFATSSANDCWSPRIREVNDEIGSASLIENGLLIIELHGYRSKNWSAPRANFPSQKFNFQLVRDAIEREAFIVIARCRKYWHSSVPELYVWVPESGGWSLIGPECVLESSQSWRK